MYSVVALVVVELPCERTRMLGTNETGGSQSGQQLCAMMSGPDGKELRPLGARGAPADDAEPAGDVAAPFCGLHAASGGVASLPALKE